MEKSVGRLVSILYRKNQVYLNGVLKPLGITAAEVPVLTFLFRNDGVSQEQLSSFLVIDKASITRALQTLAAKGYVRKERDPADRRSNRVFLTAQATEREERIYALLRQWTAMLTEGLDRQAVGTMFDVLERMADRAETADRQASGSNG